MSEQQAKPIETVRALQGWETYWALGPSRTLSETARRLGTSGSVIRRWALAFDWDERTRKRIAKEAQEREATKKDALDAFETHLLETGTALYDDALALVKRQIASGRVSASSVLALQEARAITLRGLRQPESIARTEQTGANGGPVQQEVVSREYVGIDIAVATGERSAAKDADTLLPAGSGQSALP